MSHTSQVDESLFGEPHRSQPKKNGGERPTGGDSPIEKEAAKRSAKNKRNKHGANKETVQIITKDLIRNLT